MYHSHVIGQGWAGAQCFDWHRQVQSSQKYTYTHTCPAGPAPPVRLYSYNRMSHNIYVYIPSFLAFSETSQLVVTTNLSLDSESLSYQTFYTFGIYKFCC